VCAKCVRRQIVDARKVRMRNARHSPIVHPQGDRSTEIQSWKTRASDAVIQSRPGPPESRCPIESRTHLSRKTRCSRQIVYALCWTATNGLNECRLQSLDQIDEQFQLVQPSRFPETQAPRQHNKSPESPAKSARQESPHSSLFIFRSRSPGLDAARFVVLLHEARQK